MVQILRTTCLHSFHESEAAVTEGLCPICLDAEVARLQRVIKQIAVVAADNGSPNWNPLSDALDALLAYRHGDTKHLTQDHAQLLYEQLRENARLKDLLVRAAPAVERAWGLEP
jgi:hypothetical protein